MKVCPTCQAVAFDDASTCYGCLHRFDGGVAEEGRAAHCRCSAPAEDPGMPAAGCSAPVGRGMQPPGFCIRITPTIGEAGAMVWDCAVELAS